MTKFFFNKSGFIGTLQLLIIAFILVVGTLVIYFFLNKPELKTEERLNPKKISMLVSSDLQLSSVDGIKAGLADFGYIEGRDIIYELKNPKGDRPLTKRMAETIVSSDPDLIVPVSTTATTAIREAMGDKTIPVVFVDVANIKEVKIEDIKHPGGLITGVTSDTVSAGAKRMEILKELVPKAKIFGVLMNPNHVSVKEIKQVHDGAAKSLNVGVKYYEISSQDQLKGVLDQLVKERPDGVMTTSEAIISNNAEFIASTLQGARIPSIDFNVERGVKSGYLMMFGLSRFDTGKQGARLIDKVLKGTNPGDLPIEFAQELRLELNKEVAAEIGVVFPDGILRRSKVIN